MDDGIDMTLTERVARLEAIVESMLYRLDQIVGFELHMVYTLIGGLATIAYILIRNKDE